MGWIEGDGDSDRRRLRRLRARRGQRARQPGLEGQRGFGVPCRRPRSPIGPDRAGRGAGLRLRRVPRDGRAGRAAAATRPGAEPGQPRPSGCATRSSSASGWRSWASTPSRSTATASSAGCAPPTPGHLLFAGLPSPERAARGGRAAAVAARSTPAGACARWRAGEPRFNPMSYHNGSVWPHDTALCAAGHGALRRARRRGRAAERRCSRPRSQFDMRLPELFCGFARRPGEPPIAYPVACLPQAWAAGSVFMMLQACLGLAVDGWSQQIHVDRPRLPVGIDRLTIHGLVLGEATVDVTFQRLGSQVASTRRSRADGRANYSDGLKRLAVAVQAGLLGRRSGPAPAADRAWPRWSGHWRGTRAPRSPDHWRGRRWRAAVARCLEPAVAMGARQFDGALGRWQ